MDDKPVNDEEYMQKYITRKNITGSNRMKYDFGEDVVRIFRNGSHGKNKNEKKYLHVNLKY